MGKFWFLLCILFSSTVVCAGELDEEHVFAQAEAYTLKLKNVISRPFLKDEQGVSTGTGFLIDKRRGWVLTNAIVF